MKYKILTLAAGLVAASSLSASAAIIDLVNVGDSANDGGAILTITAPGGTGSGSFGSFDRFGGNHSGLSQGMNTDLDKYLDNKPPAGPGQFTRDIQGSAVQVVDGFYLFRFDGGNPGNGLLTLQTIKLFVSGTQATSFAQLDAIRAGAPTWQTSNIYNVKNQSGNGIADMFLQIPQNLIGDSDYIYLYTESGGEPYADAGTYNEWAFLERTSTPPPPSVPDAGATMMLLGMGLVAVEGLRRKLSA